jgi:hypothetical protein
MDMMTAAAGCLPGLFSKIIDEVSAEQRRKHELKMRELFIIENSDLRNEYVQQILLDQLLSPIEEAQHQIQNTAKHAQWLAEIIHYHYSDHGLTLEQSQELST